ncbi:Ig-like domain-containing protein [Candidatus Roizmanbacteria bacterium]|nr:Ig-like domain-containing protein [Candidatus Roizmanbacteria bacterium]
MDKKLLSLISIFFLAFGIFTAAIVFEKPLTQLTRAKEEARASETASLLFAFPLNAKADGISTATITVFARANTNRPIVSRTVKLTTTVGKIKQNSQLTDNDGKATFLLTSDTPGLARIEAVVDNQVKLSQKITVNFE